MEEVKRFTDLPRAIGFGISSPEMVMSLKHHCEGVIVGSAIARLIDDPSSVKDFVKSIKKALE
jgi:tryptophan synthase alpha chain